MDLADVRRFHYILVSFFKRFTRHWSPWLHNIFPSISLCSQLLHLSSLSLLPRIILTPSCFYQSISVSVFLSAVSSSRAVWFKTSFVIDRVSLLCRGFKLQSIIFQINLIVRSNSVRLYFMIFFFSPSIFLKNFLSVITNFCSSSILSICYYAPVIISSRLVAGCLSYVTLVLPSVRLFSSLLEHFRELFLVLKQTFSSEIGFIHSTSLAIYLRICGDAIPDCGYYFPTSVNPTQPVVM